MTVFVQPHPVRRFAGLPWDGWVALLVLALTAWVLGHSVHTLPLWSDETFTLLEISGNLNPAYGVDWPTRPTDHDGLMAIFRGHSDLGYLSEVLRLMDVHPPFYYQVAWAWTWLFGTSLEAVRALSLVCALGAAGVWYLCMRRLVGPYALVGLVVVVCAPTFSYAAVNARNYGFVLLLVVGVFACVQAAWMRTQHGRPAHGWLAGAGVLAALALASHYFTVLLLGPFLLATALWAGRRGWMGVCAGLVAFGVALWWIAPFIAVQFGARPAQYEGFTAFTPEILSLVRAASNQFSVLPSPLGMMWVFLVTLVLLGAVVWASLRAPWSLARLHGLAVAGFFCALFVLFWQTDKTLRIFDAPRYALFTLPSLAFLLAGAVWLVSARIGTSVSRPVAMGVCALLVVFACSARLDPPSLSQPWAWVEMVEERTAVLSQMGEPGDLVVFTNGDYARMPPLIDRMPQDLLGLVVAGPSDVAHLESALAGARRVALIKTLSTSPVGYDASHLVVVEVMERLGFVEKGLFWAQE